MKATPSKDGVKRFDMTLKFRIGSSELVDGFCCGLMRKHADLVVGRDNTKVAIEKLLGNWFSSREAILKTAKEGFKDEGNCHVWYWSEQYGDVVTTNELRRQVVALMEKKFPDLF